MSQDEVLVVESASVDALSTAAITSGEVSTLAHELLDHSVESRALVVQGLARLAHTLLSSAQSTEVLGSSWNNISSVSMDYCKFNQELITQPQDHFNSTSRAATNAHVEEHHRA